MTELIERDDDFGYDYRIKCACDGISPLSAEQYCEESTNTAHMPCTHCGGSIHFGPLTAAIRDPADLALDNNQINRLAWYHTSTAADWPSSSYADEHRAALEAGARRFHLNVDSVLEQHLGKALHLGTYEAAIENMLRRMDDQGDTDASFYLYRVHVEIDPHRINEGYRDENDEPAAQIGTEDLRQEGLQAVRYLNTHEAIGSLSLAVLPETIVSIQTIPIPVATIRRPPDPMLVAQFEALRRRLIAHEATRPDTSSTDPSDLNLMGLGVRPDPGRIGRRTQDHDLARYRLLDEVDALLASHYLDAVSPVIQRDFIDAIGRRGRHGRGADDLGAFAERFAALAALLTHGAEIRRLVAAQPLRLRESD